MAGRGISDSLFEQDDAATPLAPEEREGLIPSCITLRRELNEAEQANILKTGEWTLARKREMLTETSPTNIPQHSPHIALD